MLWFVHSAVPILAPSWFMPIAVPTPLPIWSTLSHETRVVLKSSQFRFISLFAPTVDPRVVPTWFAPRVTPTAAPSRSISLVVPSPVHTPVPSIQMRFVAAHMLFVQ